MSTSIINHQTWRTVPRASCARCARLVSPQNACTNPSPHEPFLCGPSGVRGKHQGAAAWRTCRLRTCSCPEQQSMSGKALAGLGASLLTSRSTPTRQKRGDKNTSSFVSARDARQRALTQRETACARSMRKPLRKNGAGGCKPEPQNLGRARAVGQVELSCRHDEMRLTLQRSKSLTSLRASIGQVHVTVRHSNLEGQVRGGVALSAFGGADSSNPTARQAGKWSLPRGALLPHAPWSCTLNGRRMGARVFEKVFLLFGQPVQRSIC
jgi:hypothetical protein